jgi:hypothetical protein
MLHLLHIDLVVILVRADPFDPHDALLEINGNDQSIVIALDVEHNSVRRNDAGSCVTALHVGRAGPARSSDFVEPGIEGGLCCATEVTAPGQGDLREAGRINVRFCELWLLYRAQLQIVACSEKQNSSTVST